MPFLGPGLQAVLVATVTRKYEFFTKIITKIEPNLVPEAPQGSQNGAKSGPR